MNKYLVIGNPIDHSLSPKLHNYWINQNKIDAEYNKLMVNSENLKDIIDRLKKEIDRKKQDKTKQKYKEILEAAKLSHCDEFIDNLPPYCSI